MGMYSHFWCNRAKEAGTAASQLAGSRQRAASSVLSPSVCTASAVLWGSCLRWWWVAGRLGGWLTGRVRGAAGVQPPAAAALKVRELLLELLALGLATVRTGLHLVPAALPPANISIESHAQRHIGSS